MMKKIKYGLILILFGFSFVSLAEPHETDKNWISCLRIDDVNNLHCREFNLDNVILIDYEGKSSLFYINSKEGFRCEIQTMREGRLCSDSEYIEYIESFGEEGL